MATEKSYKDMSTDERLENHQVLRHDLVVHLTTDSNGAKSLPSDANTVNALRGLLKDNDSSIFTSRKLSIDETSAENDKKAAELLETMMGQAPSVGRDKPKGEVSNGGPKIDEERLPTFNLNDGETSSVGNDVDLDEIERHGRSHFKGVEAEED